MFLFYKMILICYNSFLVGTISFKLNRKNGLLVFWVGFSHGDSKKYRRSLDCGFIDLLKGRFLYDQFFIVFK